MKIYAELPGLRVRQLLSDAAVLAWILVWVWIGLRVKELVEALAAPGQRLEDAGGSLAGSAARLGGRADDLPLLGKRLGDAFGTVADGGRALERAGVAQQHAVHTLAIWLGVAIALAPIMWALVRYVPGRVRWVREATAATQLRDGGVDLRLFALRALANTPLSELRRISADPAGDYAAGRYEALAAVELGSLGLLP